MTKPASSPSWTLVGRTAPSPVQLTDEQTRASRPAAGVRVVLGGPGAGRTTTVVEAVVARVAAGSPLDRLVVLAPSRSEAQELRRLVALRLDRAQMAPRITTVHGFALALLREFGDQPLRLLRAPEQELRIRELLDERGPGAWPQGLRAAVPTRSFARQVRDLLARTRQLSLDPEALSGLADTHDDAGLAAAADFFGAYLDVSDMHGSLDYGELVHRARLLVHDAEVAAAIQRRFDALLVDDLQEMDAAQVELVADLAGLGLPLLATADPQQRTGAFRGASGSAVQRMSSLPAAETLHLSMGFRAGTAVSQALDSLRQRLSAVSAPVPPSPTAVRGKVTATVYDDPAAEVAHVATALRQAVLGEGLDWSDLAVVVRSGRSQVAPLARDLTRFGVPVEVAGDELPLGSQQAVQVLLLALRAAAAETPDADQALRLLTSPLAALDPVQLRRLGRHLLERHHQLGNSAQLLAASLTNPDLLDGVDLPEAGDVRRLATLLREAGQLLAKDRPVGEALWRVWDGTDWPEHLQRRALNGSLPAHHDLDAVVELFQQAERHSSFTGRGGAEAFAVMLEGEEIPADTGRESRIGTRGVRVLTAHRARAGQWRRVWVVGVQEGRWPRLQQRTLLLDPATLDGDTASATSHLADERRLMYVASARASEELHVSASQGLEGEAGQESRFLGELGVPVRRVAGLPRRSLSAPALVADLRRVASDAQASEGLRRAAALRLARLGAVEDADGHHPFRGADPQSWWGLAPTSGGEVTAPPVIDISGSTLGSLLRCPRHWFLSRRAHAERAQASRASLGEVVHLIAQRAASHDMSLEDALAQLDAVWDKIPFEAEWLSASERTQISAALERFFQWQQDNPNPVLGVEVPFQVRLRVEDAEVRLRGVVDRLELEWNRVKVVDVKTGTSAVSAKDALRHEQLGVYQLAAQLGAFDELTGGNRQVAPPSLLYLRKSPAGRGDVPLEVAQPSIDDVPALPDEPLEVGPTWVHDRLAQGVRIIRSGEFEARECSMCAWCPFAADCPALHPQTEQGVA